MVFNTKKIEELNSKLSQIENRLSSFQSRSEDFDHRNEIILEQLQSKLDNFQSAQDSVIDQYEKELQRINDLSNQLNKRIESFKILENKISKKLIEEASLEINKQLNSLFVTTNKYLQFEESLLKVDKNISTINNKFEFISNNINETDFQLNKLMNNIVKEDENKLKLIYENDKLKKLISKMRRN
jgi:chromosome segregation ATPase